MNFKRIIRISALCMLAVLSSHMVTKHGGKEATKTLTNLLIGEVWL